MSIPTDATERKDIPIFSGVMMYFPHAIAEVAKVSRETSKQHNPDKPMQWDRSKSGDEMDSLMRHALQAGSRDTDGHRHSAKVAWRALANLQKEIERDNYAALEPMALQEAVRMANADTLAGMQAQVSAHCHRPPSILDGIM